MASKYIQNNWDALRKHYQIHSPAILKEKAHIYAIDPYEWDMGKGWVWMTPIEKAIWNDIRNEGLVMYPQWPQCGFFLDFANPVAKVAIECDGREFHNYADDKKRDAILGECGWTVYRIQGALCLQDGSEDENGEYQPSHAEQLCRSIARNHKISGRFARSFTTSH